MSHPFDDKGLTFGDFKNIVDAGLRGELNFEEEPTEKTDGQNLWATIKDGEVRFARNKGDSIYPMSLSDFKKKFSDHPSTAVRDTFSFAAKILLNYYWVYLQLNSKRYLIMEKTSLTWSLFILRILMLLIMIRMLFNFIT